MNEDEARTLVAKWRDTALEAEIRKLWLAIEFYTETAALFRAEGREDMAESAEYCARPCWERLSIISEIQRGEL